MSDERPEISVAVITLNEADRIDRLLRSVAFADEVVVVDSGSDDGTVELCQDLGAKVIHRDWAGFTAQKQFALEATSGRWILNLDSDEEVTPELAEEIVEAVRQADDGVAAFSMPRLSRYLGRWIRHGGWYPDRKVRLCRRGRARWEGGRLHESLVADGEVRELENPLRHYVYRDIADQAATINRFSDVVAEERGPKGGWWVVAGAFHALGKFAECYLWKLGFLDGLAGLVIAMNSSWYVFLKHAKAWERSLK